MAFSKQKKWTFNMRGDRDKDIIGDKTFLVMIVELIFLSRDEKFDFIIFILSNNSLGDRGFLLSLQR